MFNQLGYSMETTYMKDWNTGRKMFIRITIYFRNKMIYTEDIFGPDMYYTTTFFNKQCRIHHRNKKIEQLGL